jgi:hypothetical protein
VLPRFLETLWTPDLKHPIQNLDLKKKDDILEKHEISNMCKYLLE